MDLKSLQYCHSALGPSGCSSINRVTFSSTHPRDSNPLDVRESLSYHGVLLIFISFLFLEPQATSHHCSEWWERVPPEVTAKETLPPRLQITRLT